MVNMVINWYDHRYYLIYNFDKGGTVFIINMLSENSQKIPICLSVCLACAGVGLIVASFATDHWIESHPKKINNGTSDNSTVSKAPSTITFGLFRGYSSINYGFGFRPFATKCEFMCMYIYTFYCFLLKLWKRNRKTSSFFIYIYFMCDEWFYIHSCSSFLRQVKLWPLMMGKMNLFLFLYFMMMILVFMLYYSI